MTDTGQIYDAHPLNRASILARLRRQGAQLDALTEWDLAIDPTTDITDQNHSGGVQSVLELASAAAITRSSRIADIGAGLGGSARVLAAVFGCHVVAIEQHGVRSEDARALTTMVGLDSYVTTVHHDALTGTGGLGQFDVLWGQSAWVHFPEPALFLDLWLPMLNRTGRVAMSDSFLAREPQDADETSLLLALGQAWGCRMATVAEWSRLLDQRGLRVTHQCDRSDESLAHFRRLTRVSGQWPEGMCTPFESHGWQLAIEALARGLVETVRLVASQR